MQPNKRCGLATLLGNRTKKIFDPRTMALHDMLCIHMLAQTIAHLSKSLLNCEGGFNTTMMAR